MTTYKIIKVFRGERIQVGVVQALCAVTAESWARFLGHTGKLILEAA